MSFSSPKLRGHTYNRQLSQKLTTSPSAAKILIWVATGAWSGGLVQDPPCTGVCHCLHWIMSLEEGNSKIVIDMSRRSPVSAEAVEDGDPFGLLAVAHVFGIEFTACKGASRRDDGTGPVDIGAPSRGGVVQRPEFAVAQVMRALRSPS